MQTQPATDRKSGIWRSHHDLKILTKDFWMKTRLISIESNTNEDYIVFVVMFRLGEKNVVVKNEFQGKKDQKEILDSKIIGSEKSGIKKILRTNIFLIHNYCSKRFLAQKKSWSKIVPKKNFRSKRIQDNCCLDNCCLEKCCLEHDRDRCYLQTLLPETYL